MVTPSHAPGAGDPADEVKTIMESAVPSAMSAPEDDDDPLPTNKANPVLN